MTGWSVERIGELRRLWAEGLAATEIGRRLGMTKSAVLGKAHRLSLAARPSPLKPKRTAGTQSRHPWALPAAVPARPPTRPPSGPVRDPLDPRTQIRAARPEDYAARGLSRRPCAWPIGDPREEGFHSCGSRAVRGKPYCALHCAAAYLIGRRPRP